MTLDAVLAEAVADAIDAKLAAVVEAHRLPLLLTGDQAAQLLNVSRRTLDNWLADGLLRRHPHSPGKTLISTVEVERFAQQASDGGSGLPAPAGRNTGDRIGITAADAVPAVGPIADPDRAPINPSQGTGRTEPGRGLRPTTTTTVGVPAPTAVTRSQQIPTNGV